MTEAEFLDKAIKDRAKAKKEAALSGAEKEREVYKKLSADFPSEAYSKDSSRGFDLTTLKAQYVVERLNEVLGVMNWTFGGQYKETADGGVIYEGVLIINIDGRENRQTAPGYAAKKKNLGDTYKSAQTDSFCKCASKIGVGNDMFKGLISPTGVKVSSGSAPKENSSKESEAKKDDAPAPFAKRKRSRPTL